LKRKKEKQTRKGSGSGKVVEFEFVEFVVDSLPCFEGFSPGSPVFLPP
jgi:hypothetical protein